MGRLLPLRIETNTLIHPVSLSVTMTRRSPPRAYGTTLLGQRSGAGQSCALWVPQIYTIHLLVFLHEASEYERRELPKRAWIIWAQSSPGIYSNSHPAPLLAASRGSELEARHVPSLTHSSPPVPKNGNHNWHGSPSTMPVHCENDTMPQYGR